MTVTITGSKYSGALTSVGTTTLNATGASFTSGDFAAQRIVGLWNSAGTTYKGVAWVRRWVSGTQLELVAAFIDRDGNTVTQVSGDTYLVSKNFADVATTGIAVSGNAITISDNIIFGTSGSTNSLCFYDDSKTITVTSAATSGATAYFRFAGGLSVFGYLEDFTTRKTSRGCSLINQNSTGSAPTGTGGMACSSTAAKMLWLDGSIYTQATPSYIGEWFNSGYASQSSPGEWFSLWNVYSNCDFLQANRSSSAAYQQAINLKSVASGNLSINLRWENCYVEGGNFAALGDLPLSVFGSDTTGTFTISSPAGSFLVVSDCGYGTNRPALWRSNNNLTQTINLTNVVTPNRRFGYDNTSNYQPNAVANNNATGNFYFSGLYTNLLNGSLSLIKNNNLLSTVQDSATVSGSTATLTVKDSTVVGFTETVTENAWAYGFYLYGYGLVSGTFAATTRSLSTSQTGKQVVFGGFVGQIVDVNISQVTLATVAAYTVLNTFDQLYDYAQYWKALNTTNAIYPAYNQQLIASAAGVLSTPTALNITIDTAATFNATTFVNAGTSTITLKPTTAVASGVKSDTFQLSAAKTLTFAQNGDKSGAIYLIPATGVVVVASGATNLQRSIFTSGATINVSTGTATVTVDSTTGITAGTGVTLQIPQASIVAANFQQNINVEVSRVDTYTLTSSGINTSTGVITITGHRFSSGLVPTLLAIVAQSGATLPTASVPLQRLDSQTGVAVPLLLSVVNVSGNTFQLAASDGGVPITFSNAGSGNFTVQGWTRLDFSVAGSGGYSKAFTETNGATIQVKARYWQNASGCTASTFFQNNYIWSSTTGITIPDTVSVAATPDTIHNRIIGAVVTSATGNVVMATSDGSTVTGIAADQSGVLTFNRPTGSLLVLDAYAWFVYYSSTSAGMRLVNGSTFVALDLFDFVLNNVVLNNVNGIALQLMLAYIRSANGSRLIANGSGSLYLNVGQQGIAIQIAGSSTISPSLQQIRDAQLLAPTNGATVVSGSIDAQIAAIPTTNNTTAITAIKTQTDKFVFTTANRVDSAAMTVSDKTGYSLSQAFPANFSALTIAAGTGAVTAGTVSDKTGFSLSSTQSFNLTGSITGNLSGSVGSVTGAVGSVTGAVGSVTSAIVLPTIPNGWLTAAGVGAGAITAAKFATDAIDANALASSAVSEIQAGLSTSGAVGALPTLTQIESSTVLFKNSQYTAPNNSGILSAIGAIPQNPLLTSDTRLDNLATIAAISTRTARVDGLIVNPGGGDRFTTTALLNTPTTTVDLSGINAALTAIQGTSFNTSTDSLRSIRVRGDAAWTTATGFSTFNPGTDTVLVGDKTGFALTGSERTAIATAVETQLTSEFNAIPTAIEIRQEMDTNSAIATHAKIAKQGVTNRYKIDEDANTGTLYADDGVTPIVVQALKDKDGQPASTQTYERVPQ